MNSNIIPIFNKIELLVRTIVNEVVMPSLTKVEYENASMLITGNYVVITTKETNDETNEVVETSNIFHLNEIKSYRTYNKNK